MSSNTLRQKNLKDEISRQIRQMVFTGQIAPGAKLDQETLAGEFGVSKIPLRESLIALESEGLVSNVARRGWYVAEVSPEDILVHYRMLGFLSGILAGRAAERLTNERLAELGDVLDEMNPSQNKSRAELEDLNFTFHRIINSATKSARVRSMLRLFADGIPGGFFEIVDGWEEASHQDHASILGALKNRDTAAAEVAMSEHIVRGGSHAVSFLARRGFWDDPTASS